MDPVLVILDEWSFYRGGRLNQFDCITFTEKIGIIEDESKIANQLKNYYVNVVKKISGIKPNVLGTGKLSTNDSEILKEVIQLYENHPSIIQIGNQLNNGDKIIL